MTGKADIRALKDRLRERLLKFTAKAFRTLPPMDRPRILDIGCGSGVPTMELARLGGGEVVGLDIDAGLLAILDEKIAEAGLSNRVRTVRRSLSDMDFPEESFDIVWAEGSLSGIGFKAALGEWRRLLKPGGFLVVHDEAGSVDEKKRQVPGQGYELLDAFVLDEKTWWDEYFGPLERRIRGVRAERPGSPEVLAMLDAEERELDMVKRDPAGRSRSAFFVMRKTPRSEPR